MSKIASESLAGGRKTQMRRMEVLTNNVANTSTPGYKATRHVLQAVTGKSVDDVEDKMLAISKKNSGQ